MQVCLLDLDYNLPVQVRDQALAESGAIIENLPQSDVGKEFALQAMQNEGTVESSFAKERDNPTIAHLQRTTPYYQVSTTLSMATLIILAVDRAEKGGGGSSPYVRALERSLAWNPDFHVL